MHLSIANEVEQNFEFKKISAFGAENWSLNSPILELWIFSVNPWTPWTFCENIPPKIRASFYWTFRENILELWQILKSPWSFQGVQGLSLRYFTLETTQTLHRSDDRPTADEATPSPRGGREISLSPMYETKYLVTTLRCLWRIVR